MWLDRPVVPLTYELANHSKAYLEAEQYTAGYSFLDALLTANTAISTPAKRYSAYLAQASQLALASTLIVYPLATTKAESADLLQGSDAALRYLRNVQRTVPPLHDILRTAFSFPDELSRRSTRPNKSPSDGYDLDLLRGRAANENSLWYCATDFWHIVGWAFNCSVLHKKRWERWRLWLEVMLDFLETGWDAQVRRSKHDQDGGVSPENALMGTLLWHYVTAGESNMTRGNKLKMMKAILARGTAESKSLYKQVWPRETTDDPKREENPETPIPIRVASRRAKPKDPSPERDDHTGAIPTPRDTETAIAQLGGMEAIALRQRLIALLVKVAEALPFQFSKVGDLFDIIGEEFRILPTMIYSVLLSTNTLPPPTRTALNANHIIPFVAGRLPDFTKTQLHLEDHLLPRRATSQSYAINAKLSLLLEQIFLYLMDNITLTPTEGLRKALEAGIEARNSAYGGAKKGNAVEEDVGKKILQASSERMLGLLEVLEIAAGKAAQPPGAGMSFLSELSQSELSEPPSESEDQDEDEDM